MQTIDFGAFWSKNEVIKSKREIHRATFQTRTGPKVVSCEGLKHIPSSAQTDAQPLIFDFFVIFIHPYPFHLVIREWELAADPARSADRPRSAASLHSSMTRWNQQQWKKLRNRDEKFKYQWLCIRLRSGLDMFEPHPRHNFCAGSRLKCRSLHFFLAFDYLFFDENHPESRKWTDP